MIFLPMSGSSSRMRHEESEVSRSEWYLADPGVDRFCPGNCRFVLQWIRRFSPRLSIFLFILVGNHTWLSGDCHDFLFDSKQLGLYLTLDSGSRRKNDLADAHPLRSSRGRADAALCLGGTGKCTGEFSSRTQESLSQYSIFSATRRVLFCRLDIVCPSAESHGGTTGNV